MSTIHFAPLSPSVQLQLECGLLHTSLGNKKYLATISGEDVALTDGAHDVFAKLDRLLHVRFLHLFKLIQLSNLTVENTHHERATTTTGRVWCPLKTANRIVLVHGSFTIIVDT